MRDLVEIASPTSGIILSQDNVTAKNRSESYGPGRLFITEECVYWISREQKGFILSYFEISLHAISKDPSSFPEECIYVLLDCDKSESSSDDDVEMNGNGESEGNDREVCFVPEDKSCLEAIFAAMARGQALHPDPADGNSDDEDQDEEDVGMDGGVVQGDLGAGDLSGDVAEEDQFDSEEEDQGAPPNHLGDGDA